MSIVNSDFFSILNTPFENAPKYTPGSTRCMESTKQRYFWSVISPEISLFCVFISHPTFVENFTTASSTYGQKSY